MHRAHLITKVLVNECCQENTLAIEYYAVNLNYHMWRIWDETEDSIKWFSFKNWLNFKCNMIVVTVIIQVLVNLGCHGLWAYWWMKSILHHAMRITWWREDMFDVGPLRNSHKSFQTFQWHFITGWMLKQKLAFQRAFLFALHSGSIVHKVLVQYGFWKVGVFAVKSVSLRFTRFYWISLKTHTAKQLDFCMARPNQLSECLVTRTLSDYIQWPYSPGYSYIEIISFGDISVCVTLLGRFKSLGIGAWDETFFRSGGVP